MDSVHVGIAGVAKRGTDAQPYAVANEIFCGALARALFLPVPPTFVVLKDGALYNVSLNFNLSGMDLPPADCEALVNAHPDLACGIVLFDAWVLNHDRHAANLAFDETDKRVQLFDHGHAFRPTGFGREFLDRKRNEAAVDRHCLIPYMRRLDAFEPWHDRVMQVPVYYIEEAVRTGCELGWPDADLDFCVEFLLERREKLLDFVAANRDLFPSAPDELQFSVGAPAGAPNSEKANRLDGPVIATEESAKLHPEQGHLTSVEGVENDVGGEGAEGVPQSKTPSAKDAEARSNATATGGKNGS